MSVSSVPLTSFEPFTFTNPLPDEYVIGPFTPVPDPELLVALLGGPTNALIVAGALSLLAAAIFASIHRTETDRDRNACA